jgi:hypothetical protein
MEQANRFAVPWATEADLRCQAYLYRRVAAAMRDRVRANAMADLATKHEAMAAAAAEQSRTFPGH